MKGNVTTELSIACAVFHSFLLNCTPTNMINNTNTWPVIPLWVSDNMYYNQSYVCMYVCASRTQLSN